MYAIIEIAGSQFIVKEGDIIESNKLKNVVDKGTVDITTVLGTFTPDGKTVTVGNPYVTGKTIQATIVEAELKGDKVIGAKFKRRKRYTRIIGHRQRLTKFIIGKVA